MASMSGRSSPASMTISPSARPASSSPAPSSRAPANLIAAPDYEKSAALLAEAGVSDLSLTLTVMNDSIRTATAQIIQASLEQAGIKVEIQPYDEAAFWGVGDKTQGDGYKNIDLALMDFAGGIDPSENLVWFRPDQIGAYNWSGFDSPEFETSYQQLVAESDEAKRIALVQPHGGSDGAVRRLRLHLPPAAGRHPQDGFRAGHLSGRPSQPVLFKKKA